MLTLFIYLIGFISYILNRSGYEWFKLIPTIIGSIICFPKEFNYGGIAFLLYSLGDWFLLFYDGNDGNKGINMFKYGTFAFTGAHLCLHK